MYEIIIISAVIVVSVVIIGVVVYCACNKKSESYCPCEVEKDLRKERDKKKETFFAVDSREAKVTPLGIAAPHIYTDGYIHNSSYDKITAAIDNNTPLSGEDIIGVGRGNNFDRQYEAQLEAEEINSNPTSVKSQSELEKISKKVNTNIGDDTDSMFNRAGANKGKLVLEPLGTAGVMDGYKQPERDRNHKIRMVSYAVPIQGFDMDTNRISDICMEGGSWAKGFSPNTTTNIAIAATDKNQKSALQPTQTEALAETFTK